jgi:hypothetical protein
MTRWRPITSARLTSAKARRARARAAYERFLQVWQEADPDIPEVIEAKRQLANR